MLSTRDPRDTEAIIFLAQKYVSSPLVCAVRLRLFIASNIQAYSQLSASSECYDLNHICVALIKPQVLIIYEHVALLEQEIEYMWNWKISHVTVLFLVNRYILLVSAILGILSVLDWRASSVSQCISSEGVSSQLTFAHVYRGA